MWLLLYISLISMPGLPRIVVLERYDTYDECRVERNRVGFEMAAAYPLDHDFDIVCRFTIRQAT